MQRKISFDGGANGDLQVMRELGSPQNTSTYPKCPNRGEQRDWARIEGRYPAVKVPANGKDIERECCEPKSLRMPRGVEDMPVLLHAKCYHPCAIPSSLVPGCFFGIGRVVEMLWLCMRAKEDFL